MAVREGKWDCTSCGKTMIRGPLTDCPGCGAPRPANVKFYLPSNARVVTDPEELKIANAGPNWTCSHCGSDNLATKEQCTECGALKGSSPSRPVIEYGVGEAPTHGDEYIPPPAAIPVTTVARETPVQEPSPDYSRPTYRSTYQEQKPPAIQNLLSGYLPTGMDWRAVVLGIAGALLLVVFLCLLFSTTATTATVTGISWERSINVQELRNVREEGWSLPSGANLISSYEKLYGYEQVVDHYVTKYRSEPKQVEDGTEDYICGKIDKGNGYFADKYCERPKYKTVYVDVPYNDPVYKDVPINKMYYEYTIDRWVSVGRETASGSGHSAHWPSVATGSNVRTSGAQETYWVSFKDNDTGKTHTKTYSYEDWEKFEVGATYKAKRNKLGGLSISVR